MAVPFRRTSTSRKGKRRGPERLSFQKRSYFAQPLIKCSSCQGKKILHLTCSHCLTYKGLNFQKVSNKQENQTK